MQFTYSSCYLLCHDIRHHLVAAGTVERGLDQGCMCDVRCNGLLVGFARDVAKACAARREVRADVCMRIENRQGGRIQQDAVRWVLVLKKIMFAGAYIRQKKTHV